MPHLADQLHIDKQIIDRVESAALLSLIAGGFIVCVLVASVYDFRRLLSIW